MGWIVAISVGLQTTGCARSASLSTSNTKSLALMTVEEIDHSGTAYDGKLVRIRGFLRVVDSRRLILASSVDRASQSNEFCVDDSGVREILIIAPNLVHEVKNKLGPFVIEGTYVHGASGLLDPHDAESIWNLCHGPMQQVRIVAP